MSKKKTLIKLVIGTGIFMVLNKVNIAIDTAVTGELALQQLQNTSSTLLTNQLFNSTWTVFNALVGVGTAMVFIPEMNYISERLFDKALKGDRK